MKARADYNNKIEYFVSCIGDFATEHGMTPADAFAFIQEHDGLRFLMDCYDVEHLQSIDDSVADLTDVCRRNGGVLR